MVKRFYAPLLILLMGVAITAQTISDKKRDGLTGPVAVVNANTIKYKMEAGKWETDGSTCEVKSYLEDVTRDEMGETEAAESDKAGDAANGVFAGGYGSSSGHHGYFTLDKNGDKVMTVHYSPENELIGKDYYKYDAAGYEVEESCYSPEGRPKSKTVTGYDYEHNMVEKATYFFDPPRPSKKWKWVYDSGQNPTGELYYEGEVLKFTSAFSYQYDQVGNWIERVKMITDRAKKEPGPHLKEVTTRKIEYRASNDSK